MPRDYEVHDAPKSTKAHCLVLDDVLHIWIDPEMDDLAQWRFVQQACRLNGFEPKRHRSAVLPVALATGLKGMRHAASQHPAITSAVVTTGIVAGAVGLALLPSTTVFNGGRRAGVPRPSAAAPPAVTSMPPNSGGSQPPTIQPIRATRKATPHPLPTSITPVRLRINTPVTGPVGTPRLATHLPVSPPKVRPPVPPVLADPPAPAVHPACVVRVDAAGVHVRVCLHI